jgi:hypothetical protein
MTANRFDGLDSQQAKRQIFGFTIVQIVLSVVVTMFCATSCLVSYIMTRIPALHSGAALVALFTALLAVAHAGGIVSKLDYAIHGLGTELWLKGDWHEELRRLFRFGWLNPLHDLAGFLPALLIFVLANFIIYYHWEFTAVRAWMVITANTALLIGAGILIPASGTLGRKEVMNGNREWNNKKSR